MSGDHREALVESLAHALALPVDEAEALISELRIEDHAPQGGGSQEAFERGIYLGLLVGVGSTEETPGDAREAPFRRRASIERTLEELEEERVTEP